MRRQTMILCQIVMKTTGKFKVKNSSDQSHFAKIRFGDLEADYDR